MVDRAMKPLLLVVTEMAKSREMSAVEHVARRVLSGFQRARPDYGRKFSLGGNQKRRFPLYGVVGCTMTTLSRSQKAKQRDVCEAPWMVGKGVRDRV